MLNNFKNMIQDVQKEFLWQVTKSKNEAEQRISEFIGVIQTETKEKKRVKVIINHHHYHTHAEDIGQYQAV